MFFQPVFLALSCICSFSLLAFLLLFSLPLTALKMCCLRILLFRFIYTIIINQMSFSLWFCFVLGFVWGFFSPFLNCSFYLVPDLHSVAWVEKWKNIPAIVIVNWYLTHWSVHTLPLHLQYPPHDGSRNSMSPHCGSDSSRLITVLARKSLSENDETCLWDNIASDTSLPSRQTSSHTAAHWDAHRAPEVPFPQLTSSVAGWHEQIMVTNVTQHRAGISVLPCSAVASCAIRPHLVSAFQYKEFLETAQC